MDGRKDQGKGPKVAPEKGLLTRAVSEFIVYVQREVF
jgi:hypothetical protein